MQIVSNSRQIPKTKEYIANSSYCDNLYGYLQAMSHWDGVLTHPRFVYKKEINYSKIAKDLNRSRQTISTKFKLMLEGTKENEKSGLPPLIRKKDNIFELIALESNLAMLVPQSTLEVLVSALSDHAISIYVYLFNRYYASGRRPFQFSYTQLKNAIGIAAKSNGNNYIIKSILYVLEKIGLIKYSSKDVVNEVGQLVKAHYIEKMWNELEDCPEELENNILYRKLSRQSKIC